MGSLKTLALAGALATASAGSALAADLFAPPPPAPAPMVQEFGGWYLRGDVGVGAQSLGSVAGADVISSGGSFWRKSIGDAAFAGAGIGYQFNSFLRFDVTGEYRTSARYDISDKFNYTRGSFDEIDTRQTNHYKGDLSSTVVLANAYLDLGTWGGITPFVGAGVGFAHHRIRNASDSGLIYNYYAGTDIPVDLSSGYTATEVTGGTAADGSRTNLAWAVHAGLGYQATSNLKLELAYRYLNMGDARTGTLTCLCGSEYSSLKLKDIDSHDIKFAMRWMLGGPVVAPVAVEAPLIRKY